MHLNLHQIFESKIIIFIIYNFNEKYHNTLHNSNVIKAKIIQNKFKVLHIKRNLNKLKIT